MANANIKRVRSSEIELKDKLVGVNRVTKVTKGGRAFTFSAIVVVGNEKGIVGHFTIFSMTTIDPDLYF